MNLAHWLKKVIFSLSMLEPLLQFVFLRLQHLSNELKNKLTKVAYYRTEETPWLFTAPS